MSSGQTSRRTALKLMAAGAAGLTLSSFAPRRDQMIQRAIPSTGEKIGIVGVGTWQTFDVGNSEEERGELSEVLRILVDGGGSVIDSSPMYGRSEQVVGDLAAKLNLQNDLFFATKVWTTGREEGLRQMKESMQKMRAKPMDLMQIHNLEDWKTHLKSLYEMKERGDVRYIGITHYLDSSHDKIAQIIKSETLDFIQINLSINSRNAEKSLLPIALDHGVGVLINRPYAGGSLFRATRNKALPSWAADFDCESWGQFFLKYILSNNAVTCAIPGTDKSHHMRDNLGAGMGKLPDESTRRRMVAFMESL